MALTIGVRGFIKGVEAKTSAAGNAYLAYQVAVPGKLPKDPPPNMKKSVYVRVIDMQEHEAYLPQDGDLVELTGDLSIEKYLGKNGDERLSLQVFAKEVSKVDQKPKDTSDPFEE